MYTLYCTFLPHVGWRVVSCMKEPCTVGIVDFVIAKYLRIPSDVEIRPGRFCNPKKLISKQIWRDSMIKLPDNFKYEQRVKFVVPISGAEPDFYQFGINARLICGDDKEAAEKVLRDAEPTVQASDMFWDGYLYGIERIVDDFNEIMSKEVINES